MSKMLATFAVLMLAVAGQASAATNQDFRSPDARPALVSQDYRSPDARVAGTAPAFQDLRSPDAQPGGAFQAAPAATASETSGSFNWAYLAIVVTTQNLFGVEQRGLAMLATPEEVVFESTRPGTFVLDVDLARIRDLRAQRDGVASQLENAAKAGVLSQWQRPELYDKMLRPHSPPWERERKGSEGLAGC